MNHVDATGNDLIDVASVENIVGYDRIGRGVLAFVNANSERYPDVQPPNE